MNIVAFLQLRNESSLGNLHRCLNNCKKWASHICIYDDNSTDDSREIYLQYTDKDLIIHGNTTEFNRELFHKQQLLEVALKLSPDWIGWIDGDDVFDNFTTYNLSNILTEIQRTNIEGVMFHNLNLWKDESWYRIDNQFNELKKINLWKNNGQLHYSPVAKLHQNQWPLGINAVGSFGGELIHYGFSSRDKIIEKYLRYKSCGQTGWDLDRLIDEQTSYQLVKTPKELYPIDIIPANHDIKQQPLPETYNEIRQFNNYDDYLRAIV